MEYPKINTLYKRDPETFRVIPGSFTNPLYGEIEEYIFTEKIDGRGHRVILHPNGKVEHRGRTDKSTLADFELAGAKGVVNNVLLRSSFSPASGTAYPEMTLYGELYGPKIQNGDKYTDKINFRLFDVRIAGRWLEWEELEKLAYNLEIETVPVISYSSKLIPENSEDMTILCLGSETAIMDSGRDLLAEGIVARTSPQYVKGERILWKIKCKDF